MTSEVLSQNLGIPDMPGYSETKRGVCYPLETTTIKNCSGRNREKRTHEKHSQIYRSEQKIKLSTNNLSTVASI